MEGDAKYWLWLSEIKGVGNITAKKLLKVFQTPKAIYQATKEELLSVPGIGHKTASIVLANRSLKVAESILEKMAKVNARLLTINDDLYPNEAKGLIDAPIILYYRGKLQSMGVAIIGARRCTEYGKRVTKEAAEYLANNNIPVISGMAKGIDGYAHTACIQASGITYAFLGHGVDSCYPAEHQDLMNAIIANGAVLSEYPPGTPARQAQFPRRNYLIAAWAYKLLVVEAGVHSGALITAEIARELGKEVIAVPNNVYSRESYGTNRLIAKGAQIYLEPEQLLLRPEAPRCGDGSGKKLISKPKRDQTKKEKVIPAVENAPIEERILNALKNSQMSIEQLALLFPDDRKGFLEALSVMDLEGKIKRLPGGKFSVST